ncbi:MAG: hypothetical protein LQ337_007864 [Flavoplaca oasis]|nr:MAG: hypothetical protein LQ337_007864 [Flavoplaca oasis]
MPSSKKQPDHFPDDIPQRHAAPQCYHASKPSTNTETTFATSPPSPPSDPTTPIPYRERPNVKNTLLMSDPLYRPAHLFGTSRLAPNNPRKSLDEASGEDDDWIDEEFFVESGTSNISPERQERDSSNHRNGDMLRGNMGKGEEAYVRRPHPGREAKDPRRSGSPPSRLKENYRHREDEPVTKRKLNARSETQRSGRITNQNQRSYPARREAGKERKASESKSHNALQEEIARCWDSLDRQEDAVKGNVRETPQKSSDLFASLEEQRAGREVVEGFGNGGVENSKEDEKPQRKQGKKVIKRGRGTFFA